MNNMPTIGGLKKTMEYLKSNGFDLSRLQMRIYDDGRSAGHPQLGSIPGKGKEISIRQAIEEQGISAEVIDVRLSSEEGERSIAFVQPWHCDIFINFEAGGDCVILFSRNDAAFEEFIRSHQKEIQAISRWGKPKPTIFDRCLFSLLPWCYFRLAFPS